MDYSAISTDSDCRADETEEVLEDSSSDIGEVQYISAVRTRSTKSFYGNMFASTRSPNIA